MTDDDNILLLLLLPLAVSTLAHGQSGATGAFRFMPKHILKRGLLPPWAVQRPASLILKDCYSTQDLLVALDLSFLLNETTWPSSTLSDLASSGFLGFNQAVGLHITFPVRTFDYWLGGLLHAKCALYHWNTALLPSQVRWSCFILTPSKPILPNSESHHVVVFHISFHPQSGSEMPGMVPSHSPTFWLLALCLSWQN